MQPHTEHALLRRDGPGWPEMHGRVDGAGQTEPSLDKNSSDSSSSGNNSSNSNSNHNSSNSSNTDDMDGQPRPLLSAHATWEKASGHDSRGSLDAQPTAPRPAAVRSAVHTASGDPSHVDATSHPNPDPDFHLSAPAGGDGHVFRDSSTILTANSAVADDPFTDSIADAVEPAILPEHSRHLQTFNRLADMHGIQQLLFDDDPDELLESQGQGRRGWFARAFGKPPVSSSRKTSRQSARSDRSGGGKHKRSDSDSATQGPAGKTEAKGGKDARTISLQTLVRICGKSLVYLPSEYATRSLALPTCLRATAQYLIQHGPETRGVFRISGSSRVVGELYDYYCCNIAESDIAATVRSPNLPFHIKCGVHDVASVFKRLLAGLPGGILGYVSLFDTLVSIHRKSNPKSSKVFGDKAECDYMQARLIALAIGAVPSQLQRELICAVFGLLCSIGRAAEDAEAEAEAAGKQGKGYNSMLPNSELMGYASLGIIFGPLLLGDLLAMTASESTSGSIPTCVIPPVFTSSPSPRSKSEWRRKSFTSDKQRPSTSGTLGTLGGLGTLGTLTLDKVLLANNIAEMLISHWAAIVQEMKNMSVMRKQSMLLQPPYPKEREGQPQSAHEEQARLARHKKRARVLRSSRSEVFEDANRNSAATLALPVRPTRLRKTRSESTSLDQSGAPKTQRRPPSRGETAAERTSTYVRQAVAALSPACEENQFNCFSDHPTACNPCMPLAKEVNGDARPHTSGHDAHTSTSWRAKLRPVDCTGCECAVSPTREEKPKRWMQEKDVPIARKPRPKSATTLAGHVANGDGSPSKTAALIARIMNPRQAASAATTPLGKKSFAKTMASAGAAEKNMSNSNSSDSDSVFTDPSFHHPTAAVSESQGQRKWARKATGVGALFHGNESQDWDSQSQVATPTPKRRWRGPPPPAVSPHAGNRLTKETSHGASPHLSRPSRNEENEPMVPTRKRSMRLGQGETWTSKLGDNIWSPSPKQHHAQQELQKMEQRLSRGVEPQPQPQPPLSEIKNESRGLNRSPSKAAAGNSPLKTREDALENVASSAVEEVAKSTQNGTVKAMAAMFDNAVRNSLTDQASSLSSQSQSPRTSGRLSNHSDTGPRRFPLVGRETVDVSPRRHHLTREPREQREAREQYTADSSSAESQGTTEAQSPLAQLTAKAQLQIQELKHQLDVKTLECEDWKKRAERAEVAVAELEHYTNQLVEAAAISGERGSSGRCHGPGLENSAFVMDMDMDMDMNMGQVSDITSSNGTMVIHKIKRRVLDGGSPQLALL